MAAMFSRLGLDAVMVKWLAATQVDGHMGVQRTLARRASMWVLGASVFLAGGVRRSTTWLQESLGGDEGLWTAVAWGVPAMALWGLASEMLRGLGRMAGYASVQQGVLTALAVALMLSLGLDVVSAFGAALLVVARRPGPNRMVLAHGIQGHRHACLVPGERHVVHGVAHVARVGHVLGHELDGHFAVGHFLDEAGRVYRVAFRLAAVITLVQAAVNSYAAPWFAERHAVGQRRVAPGVGPNHRPQCGLQCARLLALAVAPAWWLGWFGPAFESGAMCVLCLAFGQLECPVRSGDVFVEHDGPRAGGPAHRLVAALLNLALNVWAIPRRHLGLAAHRRDHGVVERGAAVAVHKRLGLSVWTVLRSFAQRNKA